MFLFLDSYVLNLLLFCKLKYDLAKHTYSDPLCNGEMWTLYNGEIESFVTEKCELFVTEKCEHFVTEKCEPFVTEICERFITEKCEHNQSWIFIIDINMF